MMAFTKIDWGALAGGLSKIGGLFGGGKPKKLKQFSEETGGMAPLGPEGMAPSQPEAIPIGPKAGVPSGVGGVLRGVGGALRGIGEVIQQPGFIKSTALLGASLSKPGSPGERMGTVTAGLAEEQAYKTVLGKLLAGERFADIPEAKALSPRHITEAIDIREKFQKREYGEFTEAFRMLKEARELGFTEDELGLMRMKIVGDLGIKQQEVDITRETTLTKGERLGIEEGRILSAENVANIRATADKYTADKRLEGYKEWYGKQEDSPYKGVPLSTIIDIASKAAGPLGDTAIFFRVLESYGVPVPEDISTLMEPSGEEEVDVSYDKYKTIREEDEVVEEEPSETEGLRGRLGREPTVKEIMMDAKARMSNREFTEWLQRLGGRLKDPGSIIPTF